MAKQLQNKRSRQLYYGSSEFPATSGAMGNANDYVTSGSGYRLAVPSVAAGTVNRNTVTAQIIADSIVSFCTQNGDWITNQKLQKLLYYAQVWYLALYGRRLFPEDFQAWIHGPTQPDVYAAYSKFGTGPITAPNSVWELSNALSQHIEHVFESYGHLTAFDLARLACSEMPWIAARAGVPSDEPSTNVIDVNTMKSFYKSRLNDQQKEKA